MVPTQGLKPGKPGKFCCGGSVVLGVVEAGVVAEKHGKF